MVQSSIFTKTFDLLAWLLPATLKFPREHRFVLAQRVQSSAFDFYEVITAASLSKQSEEHLQQADVKFASRPAHCQLITGYWSLLTNPLHKPYN